MTSKVHQVIVFGPPYTGKTQFCYLAENKLFQLKQYLNCPYSRDYLTHHSHIFEKDGIFFEFIDFDGYRETNDEKFDKELFKCLIECLKRKKKSVTYY